MTKFHAAAALMLFAFSSTLTMAQATVALRNGAEQAYEDHVAAWKAKDLPALEAVIALDHRTLNGNKKVSHKSDELEEAKSSPAYGSMQVDEMDSVIVKDTAVVSALLSVAGTAGGKTYHVQVRDLRRLFGEMDLGSY